MHRFVLRLPREMGGLHVLRSYERHRTVNSVSRDEGLNSAIRHGNLADASIVLFVLKDGCNSSYFSCVCSSNLSPLRCFYGIYKDFGSRALRFLRWDFYVRVGRCVV